MNPVADASQLVASSSVIGGIVSSPVASSRLTLLEPFMEVLHAGTPLASVCQTLESIPAPDVTNPSAVAELAT